MELSFTVIVGYLAMIFMVFGYLPQTIKTIRTRSTDDIAMGTFLCMGIGALFFMIQGILLNNLPLAITNVFTTSMSIIIVCIKVNNYIKKRKTKNTEK